MSIIFRSKLKFGSNIEPKRASFPNEAKIVIVGGGAQGMAIAYKLAKLKYGKDIVVLDQVYRGLSQYFYKKNQHIIFLPRISLLLYFYVSFTGSSWWRIYLALCWYNWPTCP